MKTYNEQIQKIMKHCKGTLKDSFQLEDYEEEGFITLSYLKEVFETLDLKLDLELLDYILYLIFSRSDSISKMKYPILFDLIDGKLVQTHLSQSSEGMPGGHRKRPESSSPSKIKARNQDKYSHGVQSMSIGQNEKGNVEEDEGEEEEQYEDEEFEKLLDKDDEDMEEEDEGQEY